MPTHAGRHYPTNDDMLQSMARQWLRENDVEAKRTPVIAKECAAAWRLTDDHMEAEGYGVEDLMRAFAQVLAADGRDRRSEARQRAISTPPEIALRKVAGRG